MLASIKAPGCNPREQARGEESGSKLPHSKAGCARTASRGARRLPLTSFYAGSSAPPSRTHGEKCELLACLFLRASGARILGRFVGLEEFSNARLLGVLIGGAQADAFEHLSEDARPSRVLR